MSTMSEQYQDDDDFDADPPGQQENHNLRELRKKAKERDQFATKVTEIEAERDAAKRELAMVRAGIDLDSPTGRLFVKAYDGEASTEAIRSAAAEYGLIQADASSEEEQTQEQALSRLANSTQGSGPVGGGEKWTEQTYASWDPATRNRFRTQHRQQFEALKRGEAIAPVSGF